MQLADSADKIEDPSIAWPDLRKTVDLGEIVVVKAVPDSAAQEQALLFIENALPDGIEPADPMINARSEIYAVSYARRHQQ